MILPRHLTASEIAADLRVSKRKVAAMMAVGAFGPVLSLGERTKRVTRAGYEQFLSQVTQQERRLG